MNYIDKDSDVVNNTDITHILRNTLFTQLAKESGMLGEEFAYLMAKLILAFALGAVFLMINLKVFILNNQERFSEEEFKILVIKRTIAINEQQNSHHDDKSKDVKKQLNSTFLIFNI